MTTKIEKLDITGFRALSRLEVEGFSDVNLIVGKNNTGKTTILEALLLLFSSDVTVQLFDFFESEGGI